MTYGPRVWEEVADDGSTWVHRLKVPSGWVYNIRTLDQEPTDKNTSKTLLSNDYVFVPVINYAIVTTDDPSTYTWEDVQGDEDKIQRLKVPSGWIYYFRTMDYDPVDLDGNKRVLFQHYVFVPQSYLAN
jgi:hypothetical protein